MFYPTKKGEAAVENLSDHVGCRHVPASQAGTGRGRTGSVLSGTVTNRGYVSLNKPFFDQGPARDHGLGPLDPFNFPDLLIQEFRNGFRIRGEKIPLKHHFDQ